jgi:hypothetical protein
MQRPSRVGYCSCIIMGIPQSAENASFGMTWKEVTYGGNIAPQHVILRRSLPKNPRSALDRRPARPRRMLRQQHHGDSSVGARRGEV